MKRLFYFVVFGSLLCLYPLSSTVRGQENETVKLEEETQQVDQEAQNDEGRNKVVSRLKDEFAVDDKRIQDLRDKKLGYGEVGIVLSLAEQMPGGITDENVQKIMDLRQGDNKTGWGNVAKSLDLNLGKTISQVKRAHNPATDTDSNGTNPEPVDAQEPTGSTKFEHPNDQGKAMDQPAEKFAPPGKTERAEKIERIDRPAKIDRPVHPDHPGRNR